MDYIVVNGMGGVPQRPIRAIAATQNRIISAAGATYKMTPVLKGVVDLTGLDRVVNRYGITGAGGGGTGPSLPTFGQIFPSGR